MKNKIDDSLEVIENYSIKDSFNLIDYVQSLWTYKNMFIKHWEGKILHLELHTGGFSENEKLIDALLKNKIFKNIFFECYKKGGHYYFKIDPIILGYRPPSYWVEAMNVSRVTINKTNKLEFIYYGKQNKNKLYRLKRN